MLSESLVTRCKTRGWNRIAFVGLSKHAGKTTALNHFVTAASTYGERIGLVSVGLDGERRDSIMGAPKPSIYAPEGTLVVSAEKALAASDAKFEWIEELPIHSPMGSAVAARVTIPGNVMLAGIRQRMHIELAIPMLERLGAQITLVDGAFDRIAAAAPHLIDAVILAIGATAGRTEGEVAEAALPFIAKFQLPVVSDTYRAVLGPAVESGLVGLVRAGEEAELAGLVRAGEEAELAGDAPVEMDPDCAEGGVRGTDPTLLLHQLPANQALFGLSQSDHWHKDISALYIPGAVTDSLIEELMTHPRAIELVAAHPAQIIVSDRHWRDFSRRGHRLTVWTSVPIAGIAVNPYHIHGHWFDRDTLFRELSGIAGDVPLYDAMST